MKTLNFTFQGKSYSATETESFELINNETGKKLRGIYLRGTKMTGRTDDYKLRFMAGRDELNTRPRYQAGAKGFMTLMQIIEVE